MLGYSAAEFAAMQFQEYTHADDIAENLRHFDAIMNGPQHAYQFEKRCFRKDGEMIWVRVTSAAERDENGERNYAITMLEDITERKLAEQRHLEQARLNEHQATHDALTGLGNRRKLYGDVERALDRCERALVRARALRPRRLQGLQRRVRAPGGRRAARAPRPPDGGRDRRRGDRLSHGRRRVLRLHLGGPIPAQVVEEARLALCDQGEGFSIRCSRGAALVPSEAGDLERALQLADERLYRTSARAA